MRDDQHLRHRASFMDGVHANEHRGVGDLLGGKLARGGEERDEERRAEDSHGDDDALRGRASACGPYADRNLRPRPRRHLA